MKKNITGKRSPRRKLNPTTIGMDLGDKTSHYCVLERDGQVRSTGTVPTTKKGMLRTFSRWKRCRLAMEVGTHSPWVSRLLQGLGYEVIVANARRVRLITDSSYKNDKLDARTLARLARADPELLYPIQHRSVEAQQALVVIRARAGLVEARTKLVNTVRGLAKPFGERIPKCDAAQMSRKMLEGLPAGLQQSLQGLAEAIEKLSEQIKAYDQQIEQIASEQYPETMLLKQVSGVGTLIALTFMLTLGDAGRFEKSRDVGCYLGLRPKQSQSGDRDRQLAISKEGDIYLRKLLVQAAQHVLSRRGPDTDLKRWGLRRSEHGGKNAKKKAIVGVARKLAVLLHHLWVSGEVYEPLRHSQELAARAAA